MYVLELISNALESLRMDVDNVGDDCPVFDGLFEYCSISAGGSMGELEQMGLISN
jgi:hypothetical protein